MFKRLNAFYSSCGILLLSLYCRVVLAQDQTVNTGVSPAMPSPAVPAPAPAPAPSTGGVISTAVNQPYNNTQVTEGIFVMLGSMFFMFAIVWMVIVVLGKVFGGKRAFKKPLILGAIGLVMIIIGRHIAK